MKHRHLWFGLGLLVAAVLPLLISDRISKAGPDTDEAGAAGSRRKVDQPNPDEDRSARWKSREPRPAKTGSGQPESPPDHLVIGDVVNPFDQEELARLAEKPEKDPRRLTDLIHRAAAEKDVRFRYLADQQNLRQNPAMDLAVSAYDYAVNGNQKALDHILDIHSKEPLGSDSDSVVTLSYIDEWDVTIKAYETHFSQGSDGAASIARLAFWAKRKHLFPHSHRKFEKGGSDNGGGSR